MGVIMVTKIAGIRIIVGARPRFIVEEDCDLAKR
jgi:hypothetical protein